MTILRRKSGGEFLFVGASCATGRVGSQMPADHRAGSCCFPLGLCRGFFSPLLISPSLNLCHLALFNHCIFSLLSSSSYSHFLCLHCLSLPSSDMAYQSHWPIHVQCSFLNSSNAHLPPRWVAVLVSLSFSSVSDHLHAPSLALLAVSLPLWPFPILLHPSMSHTVLLPVIPPFPIHPTVPNCLSSSNKRHHVFKPFVQASQIALCVFY